MRRPPRGPTLHWETQTAGLSSKVRHRRAERGLRRGFRCPPSALRAPAALLPYPRETHFSSLRLRSSGHPQSRNMSPRRRREAAATSPYERPRRRGCGGGGGGAPRGTAAFPPALAERDPRVGLKRAAVVPFSPSRRAYFTWLILPVTYACLKD